MAKFQLPKGEASVILTVFIQDSSKTTGEGLADLDEGDSIVGGYVQRNGIGVALVVDENVTTEGTYQAPSVVEKVRIGTPANMRTGVYELHFHDDLFAGADWVTISLGGASNMAELLIEVQLVANDPNTAGVTLQDDAITLAKFDESTAWPLVAVDSGATQVARVGADGDTLEGLSGQIDSIPTEAMRGTDSASTHNAAAVWTAGSRELSTPSNYKANVSGLSTHDAAAVWTAANRALSVPNDYKATGFSTHDAADVKTAMEADGSKLDQVWEMTENDEGIRRLTTNALEQAPDTITGITLADDAITSAKYDESSAFPLKADDNGATQIARVGADGDTLETLSDQIDEISGTGLTSLHSGSAQDGASGSITLAAGASATNNLYNGQVVKVTSGTGAGQARLISAYNGTSKVATTVPNWTTNPADGSVYEVVDGPSDVQLWRLGQPNVLVSGAVDADVSAIQDDVIDANVIAANAIGSSELATTAIQEIARAINPQKNSTFSNFEFEMFDSTNHNPATGKTVTGQRSIDGGTYAGVSGSIAGVGNGTYKFDAEAADMNGDFITFRFSNADTDDTFVHVKTAA